MESSFEIYVVIKCKYSKITGIKENLSQHTHNFYQLVYVAAGSGYIQINNENIRINKNDIILLLPGVKHMISCKNEVMTTYEVKFNLYESLYKEILKSYPVITADSDEKILPYMKKIIVESKKKEPFWLELVNLNLMEIVYQMNRLLLTEKAGENDEASEDLYADVNNKIFLIADYIEKNYTKHITRKELADMMFYSESYFTKEFKKYFNVSPMKYINDVRLKKAKELLKSSEYSITQIAQMTGFASVHYFSRYFKNQELCNPNEYRKLLRDAFTIYVTNGRT